MATNPESSEERQPGFIRRTVEAVSNATGSKSWRRITSIPLAAAFASLAPEPFGQIAAALIALIALESR